MIVFNSQQPVPACLQPVADAAATALPLDLAVVEPLSAALRAVLKLSLFGYDVIVDKEDGRLFIIDINYFPGKRPQSFQRMKLTLTHGTSTLCSIPWLRRRQRASL